MRLPALRNLLVYAFSIALVVLVTWFVPALSAATMNALFRVRGALAPPADIVIIAIDDASLQRVSQLHGAWPWPRTVMADLLDNLTLAQPRAIGLDVIYAEPSTPAADERLAQSLKRNGRVVLPTQLYETSEGRTEWLLLMADLASASQHTGHAHIAPAIDGVVRSVQLSKADDHGRREAAFSLSVISVADEPAISEFKEEARWLQFGRHRIPVTDEAPVLDSADVTIIRGNEMLINFIGPAGSFKTFSFADVLEGQVAASAFNNKIVLIGATAESMGDSRVIPFMHFRNARREGGQEMPGVEIHANIIHSIRQGIALRAWPDWLNFLAALAVVLLVALVLHRFAGWRQLALLGLLLVAIVLGSYFAFSRFYQVPPLAPMLTGFLAIVPLLLNRALTASRELDIKLAALVRSQQGFLLNEAPSRTDFINRQLSLALPQSLTWKLRAVDDLTARMLARASFINQTLASMHEGVLVTDMQRRLIFANREAQQIFNCREDELLHAELTACLTKRGRCDESELAQAITRAVQGHGAQLEFTVTREAASHFTLTLSPLAETNARPIGIVVLLADITKRVELDRIKTETLQLVSHELRTPLTSIQGLSDVLRKFPVEAAQSGEMLDMIHAESVRLGETINRYLDLTRLESGAQSLQLAPINVAQLIETGLRNVAVMAAERGISLTSECQSHLPALRGDLQLLTQALSNLLSNAVKYSPPDTTVEVRAEAAETDDQTIRLHVRDQGFGIPPEAQARVFEKFYRLERDAHSTIVGTGLGLALVKEIVERHGGRVTFANNAEAGTTFTMTFLRGAGFSL